MKLQKLFLLLFAIMGLVACSSSDSGDTTPAPQIDPVVLVTTSEPTATAPIYAPPPQTVFCGDEDPELDFGSIRNPRVEAINGTKKYFADIFKYFRKGLETPASADVVQCDRNTSGKWAVWYDREITKEAFEWLTRERRYVLVPVEGYVVSPVPEMSGGTLVPPIIFFDNVLGEYNPDPLGTLFELLAPLTDVDEPIFEGQ